MLGLEVGYAGALAAGVLSFLSPCVLPLVPPYLCFLGGVGLGELTGTGAAPARLRRPVLAAALAFVLGFSTVFVALGASATALGRLVAEHLELLARVAGVVVILLGLHFLGVLRIGALFRDLRFGFGSRPAGLAGAYLVGLAFAFGWTPCVGPVLAAILFVAAGAESAGRGAALLGTYAAGLGIPFLLAAAATGPFMRFLARFRRHLGTVERVIGALLIATGVLFLTGSMSRIGFWLLETFPILGTVG